MTFVPESRLAFVEIWVPSKPETGIKEGFEEMELEFSFGTFRLENRTTFSDIPMLLVPFTFQRTFRKLFDNVKQPKAHKLTVFPGFAIPFSLELFTARSNYSQLLNSHLLLLFRRVLFFSFLCCSSLLIAVFLIILFMSATSTMYKSKSLPERFMVKLNSYQSEPKTL